MTKREISEIIFLSGYAPNYILRTGGIGGLPHEIDMTNAATGFAIRRVLRTLAEAKPELFGNTD